MAKKLKVLFVCTGNACRSQMAEGFARRLQGGVVEPWSAGVMPCWVDPRAIQVMREVGIDITRQRSKHVDEVKGMPFDAVVMLCDYAASTCGTFPKVDNIIEFVVEDPPGATRRMRREDQKLEVYRRVRDRIRGFVERMDEKIKGPKD
ncbi:MAG: arsenate reductase ArsC [Planctomycetota bacterium]